MGFETLTLAPIDRRLVVPELLSVEELAWLNAYHARVLDIIGPDLGPTDRAWLETATAKIPSPQASSGIVPKARFEHDGRGLG
jgi:Xaa-Pro aminopeptidase